MNNSPKLDQHEHAENSAHLVFAEIRANTEVMEHLHEVPGAEDALALIDTYGPEKALQMAQQETGEASASHPETLAPAVTEAQGRSAIKRKTTHRLAQILPFMATLLAGSSVATAAPGDPPPPPPRGGAQVSTASGGSDKVVSKPAGNPGPRLTKEQIEALLKMEERMAALQKELAALKEAQIKQLQGQGLPEWARKTPWPAWMALLLAIAALVNSQKKNKMIQKVVVGGDDTARRKAEEAMQLATVAKEASDDAVAAIANLNPPTP